MNALDVAKVHAKSGAGDVSLSPPGQLGVDTLDDVVRRPPLVVDRRRHGAQIAESLTGTVFDEMTRPGCLVSSGTALSCAATLVLGAVRRCLTSPISSSR